MRWGILMVVMLLSGGTGTVVFSSHFGGAETFDCDGITVSEAGDLWLACHGGPDTNFDAWVKRVDPRSGRVVFTTRIGGSTYDGAFRIRVDRAGFAYAVGFTKSTDFSVTPDAVQRVYGGGDSDAFLVKLDPQGRVVYSTLYGGPAADQGDALALDADGTVYLGGTTWSKDAEGDAMIVAIRPGQPTAREFVLERKGPDKLTGLALDGGGHLFATGYSGKHAFVLKLDVRRWKLESTRTFGRSGEDSGWGIAVDSKGAPVIAGITQSRDLPVTAGAFQRELRGKSDAFVAKFDASLRQVRFATYFGGSGKDEAGYDGDDITVDAKGRVWLVGSTGSRDLPLRNAVQSKFGGGELDGFIAGFSADGSRLEFSTYWGGAERDSLEGVALARSGELYATGLTASRNLPMTGGSVQREHGTAKFGAMVVGLRLPR